MWPFRKKTSTVIEETRDQRRLAAEQLKANPVQHELAKQQILNDRELAKLTKGHDAEDRAETAARRWRNVTAAFAALGNFLIWTARTATGWWVTARGWVADRLVVIPILFSAGAAVYGQMDFITDDTKPFNWPFPIAVCAAVAVEITAFVLFRSAKRGMDAGDVVRLDHVTGWGIVAGAVSFNAWHLDPLAGFLSAIGPIAWEVRERRERRNREITEGVRGRACTPLPRFGLLFWWFYGPQRREMLRLALWNRAQQTYPGLAAQVEHDTAARELAESVDCLSELVATIELGNAGQAGNTAVSSQAAQPGNAGQADQATQAATLPGNQDDEAAGQPGNAGQAAVAGQLGNPGLPDRQAAAQAGNGQLPVHIQRITVPGSDHLGNAPAWGTMLVTALPTQAGNGQAEQADGSGNARQAAVAGQTGSGQAEQAPTPSAAAGQPGSDGQADAGQPGSGLPAQAGSGQATTPGNESVPSHQPNPMTDTMPMPRLVLGNGQAEQAGNAGKHRHLQAVPGDLPTVDATLLDAAMAHLAQRAEQGLPWAQRDQFCRELRDLGHTVGQPKALWKHVGPLRGGYLEQVRSTG